MIELLGKNIFIDNDFEIKEYLTEMGNIKVLINKGAIYSASFTDENLRNELCDYYMTYYDMPNILNPNGKKYLVLGGGAFSYPKYYISHYLDKDMVVIDNDNRCIEIANKYFYLDELIKTYDPDKKRLKILIEDAIQYVANCIDKFDYILIDLFNGKRPLKEMFFKETLNNLKRLLKDNAIVVINYVVCDENISNYKEEINNLFDVTKYHKIITNDHYYDFDKKIGNLLIVLSNNFIEIPENYNYIEVIEF